jgi:hypothetical protein
MFKSSASYAHVRLRAVFGAGNRNKNKTGVVAMPAAIPSVPFCESGHLSECKSVHHHLLRFHNISFLFAP